MSYTASKELCQELYQLSGWKSNIDYWKCKPDCVALELNGSKVLRSLPNDIYIALEGFTYEHNKAEYVSPAYDLGYLLRKLPKSAQILKNNRYGASKSKYDYRAAIWKYKSQTNIYEADTPEDAACKLAIELFKQGVLKP